MKRCVIFFSRFMSRTVARLLLLVVVEAHEYLSAPLSRTGSCLLNGVIMGSKICQTHTTPDTSDDVQCLDDKLTYSHLFHVHPAYENFACGGSTLVKGSRGGSQGLLQECGDLKSDPTHFNMSLPGPGEVATYKAGQEVELGLKGFFHQGVMRVSLCFYEDSACSSPSHFTSYVLGYHFSEGTSGDASAPEGIYSVVLGFKVRMPNRKGRAALQWLVDAEDVRSYVSCTTIEIIGATIESPQRSPSSAPLHGPRTDSYACNGHPLCNCTTTHEPTSPNVGLGLVCPQGTSPSVINGTSTGTDIVAQYKAQLGVDVFCGLCISNGCPSSCGGKYNGFYQGPKCTNAPVLKGCGATHETALPKYIECSAATCTSSGWSPSL